MIKTKQENSWTIRNKIIVFFVLKIFLVSLISFIIIRFPFYNSLTDDLLASYSDSTKDLAIRLADPIFAENKDGVVSLIFDSKNTHKEIAYIIVLKENNDFLASTFVGDVPKYVIAQNTLLVNEDKKITKITFDNKNVYDVAARLNYNQGTLRIGYYKDQIDAVIKKANYSFLGVIFILFLSIILFIFYITRLVIRPIEKLKKGMEKFSQGKLGEVIEISSNDEIGGFARSFNKMSVELYKTNKELEKHSKNLKEEVAIKTEELSKVLDSMKKDKEKMQAQRLATMNILEDVSESQKDLEKTYQELEQKNQTINTLKNVSQDLSGAMDIEEAIHIAISHIEKNFDFYDATFLIYEIIDSGIIYQNHLFVETCETCLEGARHDLEKYLEKNKQKYSEEAISIIKNVKPKHTGKTINNNAEKISKEFSYYPLVSGDTIFGLIQLSFSKDNVLKNETKELLQAIINAFTLSLERLQTIVLAQQSKTVSLVESLKDGVIMFNTKEDLVIMNKAFSHYTGFSNEYFSLNDLYRLIADQKVSDMVKASISKGKISNISDVKLINKYYEIIILPVRDNKENIVGGAIIFHDITRLKEIDQMKTEFVSVASHQLRTPLTAIKLFTEMLIKEQVGKLKKEQKEYLENIYESTERMVRLVNDLLNVSRIESGKLRVDPQDLKVYDFIETVIAEAKPLAELKNQKINFVSKINKKLKVPLDKNLIRQVFHNLIVNAIRYSPEKTGKVKVELSEDKKNFIISVRDNGIGIPEEAQNRIFEKFFRAENAVINITEGTGLGLYVSKMIVVSSNGKIWFESKKDKGTCFYVSLPLKGMKEKKGERGLAIS